MRIRYRRLADQDSVRDYEVRTQDRPRGRWVTAGLVSGFGSAPVAWAALSPTASAWTSYRRTRAEAVRDMLAGRTFRDEPTS